MAREEHELCEAVQLSECAAVPRAAALSRSLLCPVVARKSDIIFVSLETKNKSLEQICFVLCVKTHGACAYADEILKS